VKRFILILLCIVIGCSSPKYFFGELQEIRLIEFNNMHFINVTLNGEKTRLLIDTGASKSLLDITQSKKYGFAYSKFTKKQYIGLGGITDVYTVYYIKLKDIPFIAFLGGDLSEVREYFNKNEIYFVGILGADFLEHYRCKIDFEKNILYYK